VQRADDQQHLADLYRQQLHRLPGPLMSPVARRVITSRRAAVDVILNTFNCVGWPPRPARPGPAAKPVRWWTAGRIRRSRDAEGNAGGVV
jgi:hypothetical protein